MTTPSEHPVHREKLRLDVSDVIPLAGRFETAVDLVRPESLDRALTARPLLFCLPGGFLSRGYFDLGDPRDPVERGYSMAEWFARRGFAVACVDHVGVGESSKPDPVEGGYELGVDEIVAADARALQGVREHLGRTHGVDPDCLRSIGIGHSMGAALCVAQQANFGSHAALILQSFGSAGLPAFLEGDEPRYANRPEQARRDLGRLVAARFGTPYPGGPEDRSSGTQAAFGVGSAPPLAEALLRRASTNLLGTCGLLTMIPGGYAPYAEKIETPCLVAAGDHDLVPAEAVPPMLPRAARVDTFTLTDSWHCHLVANTRTRLWQRMLDWIEDLGESRGV